MLWDSDCSDFSEESLTPTEIQARRSNYTDTLRAVLQNSLAHPSIEYILVTGPILLGEAQGHKDQLFGIPALFFHYKPSKEQMLDEYRGLNEAVVQEFSTMNDGGLKRVEYLDLRSIFLEAIPRPWWVLDRWYVTIDGEHVNRFGTELIVSHVARRIDSWLTHSQIDNL
jgi:hypothetical protein